MLPDREKFQERYQRLAAATTGLEPSRRGLVFKCRVKPTAARRIEGRSLSWRKKLQWSDYCAI